MVFFPANLLRLAIEYTKYIAIFPESGNHRSCVF